MNNHILVAILTIALIFSFISYLLIIPLFKSKEITQTVRLIGPKEHYKKNKTPVLGGTVIVSGTLISLYLLLYKNPLDATYSKSNLLILIVAFLGYFLLGLLDDLKIIKRRSNDGLSIKSKFLGELVIAVIIFFFSLANSQSTIINLYGLKINLYFFYGIFLIFYFMSYTNAVNFTDGIDGLAGGVSLIISTTLTVIAYKNRNYLVFYFGLSLITQLIAFLFFNINKAQIFMGDTGSLAIGGALAAMAIILKVEMFLLIMGIVFFLEALSVVIQIYYYKKYKKRVFKMAPIHHHLELCKWNEWQIDILAWIITTVFCILGFMLEVLL